MITGLHNYESLYYQKFNFFKMCFLEKKKKKFIIYVFLEQKWKTLVEAEVHLFRIRPEAFVSKSSSSSKYGHTKRVCSVHL